MRVPDGDSGPLANRLAQNLHSLLSGTRALPGSAFHKALELDRAMLAREVDWPLARTLVAAEVSVLPDTPAGVLPLSMVDNSALSPR